MENLRVFQAIWIGPTDTRGDRVRLTDHRTGKKVIIPVKYTDEGDARDIAVKYLTERGIEVMASGTANIGYFLMSTNFENQIR